MSPATLTPRRRGAAPWTPLDLLNLFAWWSADQKVYSDAGTTLAVNDDPVRRWVSMNDAAIYAEQSTLGNRPIYVTDDGAPYVWFDGTDNFMSTNIVGSDIDTTVGLTVWVNFFVGGNAADTCVVGSWGNHPTGNMMFLGWDTGPKSTWQLSDGPFGNNVAIRPASTILPTIATWCTYAGLFDNSSNAMAIRLNNTELATGSFTLTPTGDQPISFGRLLPGVDRWLNGYIRDVVIVERQLTSAELLLLEGYAA